MTYDPNSNIERPPVNRPAAENPNVVYEAPRPARSSAWAFAAVAAVIVLGVVVWTMMSNPGTDPATTSATTPPAVTDTAPKPDTMTAPADPAANNATPVAPEPAAPKP